MARKKVVKKTRKATAAAKPKAVAPKTRKRRQTSPAEREQILKAAAKEGLTRPAGPQEVRRAAGHVLLVASTGRPDGQGWLQS